MMTARSKRHGLSTATASGGRSRRAGIGRRIRRSVLWMSAALVSVQLLADAAQAQEVTTFAPGNYTYTVPAGVTRVKVRVVGGGGGTGDDFVRTENGNGGAARIIDAIVNVSPGTVVSGTVGSGGKAGYVDSGGAGGTGTGRGGSGGSTATASGGSPGGGGGGGSSLALGSTVILKAGGDVGAEIPIDPDAAEE
ncbi:hypothetical protein [Sinorhizobium meliloti]|jgi:hypothetical protein|uniref:glycine-rich domain-containing protein n=1 Tax=Rhizobium meliloti TaxID=382 RepID=UPI0020BE96C3|nr:hypothetical protein [Sinorhizobium meliloti]